MSENKAPDAPIYETVLDPYSGFPMINKPYAQHGLLGQKLESGLYIVNVPGSLPHVSRHLNMRFGSAHAGTFLLALNTLDLAVRTLMAENPKYRTAFGDIVSVWFGMTTYERVYDMHFEFACRYLVQPSRITPLDLFIPRDTIDEYLFFLD